MVLDGIKNAPGAPHEPSADVAIVQYATRRKEYASHTHPKMQKNKFVVISPWVIFHDGSARTLILSFSL